MSEYAASLEAFCRREHPRLAGTLTLYTGDADLAAELAQEALARVCVHWERVSLMAAPGAWAHRVAINLANSAFSRRAAGRRARERHEAQRDDRARTDAAELLAVRDAVRGLPQRQRTALILRYFADLSVADTATAMGCAPGTVKALTSQGIAGLRRAGLADLEPDGDDDETEVVSGA